MTEISTNEVTHAGINKPLSKDQINSTDDLNPHEQQFYKAISSYLNRIQFLPKTETVLKIITYSRLKK